MPNWSKSEPSPRTSQSSKFNHHETIPRLSGRGLFPNIATMRDTFYFSHDYNARTDPKLQKVLMKHGCTGIGVYWCVIEQIYEQGGCLPLSDCESIAFALRVDEMTVESIVRDFGLFDNDGVKFWSDSVYQRLNKRAEISEKRKKAAFDRWNKTKDDANGMQVHENPMQDYANKGKERKGKKNKGNVNESNELDSSENEFSDAHTPEQVDGITGQGKEKSSAKKEKIDFDAVVDLFHTHCPSFPRIIKLSDARKLKIKTRLVEMKHDLGLLESVFTTMESSKFLRGDNKNQWQATFDWVFDNEKNWLKVIEGNYNDKAPAGGDTQNVNAIWK